MSDISFAARFDQMAEQHPEAPAVTLGGTTLTFAELNDSAIRLAKHLQTLGVTKDDLVTIAEPNSIEFVTSTVACWKLGATPQPVSSRLPTMELDAIVDLAQPRVVIGVDLVDHASIPLGFTPPDSTGDPLPDIAATAWKAPTSGGSTGRPKLIVSGDPSVHTAGLRGLATIIGGRPEGTVVMPGPLYHNGPFMWTFVSLLMGAHVVILPRFDATATLTAIEDHSATAIYLVPTMMQRMWKLPEEERDAFDLSSLEVAFHLAEPCPPWLKEVWIDWVGPEVLWELYGGTEGQAFTILNGNDWLEHKGSVGRPISGEIVIRDENGQDLPPGEVGDVWMRPTGRDTPTYRYIGAEPEEMDGWECLGDVGWMDSDGFLYLADRRNDMILVGGANIYPAEVEAALNEHPSIASSAVIGLPDPDKGNRVHAIVQSADADPAELKEFLGERLVRYKIPTSFELVSEPLRDDAGKVRRGALREARLSGS